MGFWDFCNANPWFPAGCALLAAIVAYGVSDNFRRAAYYRAKHASIAKQGWPPLHCTADGDPIDKWDRGYDLVPECEQKGGDE